MSVSEFSLTEPAAIDVSLVVAFHAEGLLAQPALLAAARCRAHAEHLGLKVELVLALDRPSTQTRRLVTEFELNDHDQLLELQKGDVGACRNVAIRESRGRNVAICDGDDFLSANFLQAAHQLLKGAEPNLIVRPQLVMQFDQDRCLAWQDGSDRSSFDPACMLSVNPWTSACMADKSVFLRVPYWQRDDASAGLGFEDWHWNCETLAGGCINVIAPQTVHYVRVKAEGSLNARSVRDAALVPPTRLFEALR